MTTPTPDSRPPAPEHPLAALARAHAKIAAEFPHCRVFTEGLDWPSLGAMDIPDLDTAAVTRWLDAHAGPRGEAWTSTSDPAGVSWAVRLKSAEVFARFVEKFGAGTGSRP